MLCNKHSLTHTHKDAVVVLQRELDRIAEVLREQAKKQKVSSLASVMK